jgi:hypothetical protein
VPALELRDRETEGYTRRVSEETVASAREKPELQGNAIDDLFQADLLQL